MGKAVQVNWEAQLEDDCDVLVVGGGPSGVAAAISAARLSKNVVLLEQSGQLGGMGTLANVSVFMPVGNVTGIYKEICEKVVPESFVNYDPYYYAPQFNPFYMRYTLLDMVVKEGIRLYLHTRYVVPLKSNEHVSGVTAVTREGLKAFRAKIVIDCTGDGRVAIDSGAEYTTGHPETGLTQPGTLMFQMQNTGKKIMPYLPEGCYQYQTVKDLPQGRTLYWEHNTDGTLLVNMTRIKGNGSLIRDVEQLELEGIRQVFSVAYFLQKNGFETYAISSVAPQTGIRETNQVVGLYTLSDKDVQSAARFCDAVARTNYEVDIHNPNGEKSTEEFHVDSYDIPYRVMVPKGLYGILVSGRAVSATHMAMSSLRVMPTCYALGQAAGIASAIAIEDGVELKDVNMDKIHQEMTAQGCSVV